MSIDPNNPSQDQNPHSPLPGRPDPLSPGQIDFSAPREPGVEQLPDSEDEHPLKHDRSDGGLDPEPGEDLDDPEKPDPLNARAH